MKQINVQGTVTGRISCHMPFATANRPKKNDFALSSSDAMMVAVLDLDYLAIERRLIACQPPADPYGETSR